MRWIYFDLHYNLRKGLWVEGGCFFTPGLLFLGGTAGAVEGFLKEQCPEHKNLSLSAVDVAFENIHRGGRVSAPALPVYRAGKYDNAKAPLEGGAAGAKKGSEKTLLFKRFTLHLRPRPEAFAPKAQRLSSQYSPNIGDQAMASSSIRVKTSSLPYAGALTASSGRESRYPSRSIITGKLPGVIVSRPPG